MDDVFPKAKRIRGCAKEMPAEDTLLTKGEAGTNALADRLLSLWCHGHLSAVLIQELALLASLGGAEHPDLALIGKAGNFGQVPGNCHRDIMTNFCHGSHIPEGYNVKVNCKDPKTSKKASENASVLLPHLLFAELDKSYEEQFHSIFGTHALEEFWTKVERACDDRLTGHPICFDKRHGVMKDHVQDKAKTIPLFIHGDGVEYQGRDSLFIWNWGGLLNQFNSLSSHFLISAFPKSCTLDDTWAPIMSWVRWSLEALQDGVHPESGPEGDPLPKGFLEDLAGQPLAKGGYRAVVWSIQGDHGFYSLVLGLPHWNSASPCDAKAPQVKGKPCPPGKSFKILKEEDQKYVYVDTEQALSKGCSHPFFSIPGLTTRMVRHGGLHILFCKGVCSHLLGSILHFLCYFNGKGHQKVKPSVRLGLIFQEIQSIYRVDKTPTRLTNLRLTMFTDVKKPHVHFPKLDVKGAECKHLCMTMLPVMKKMLCRTIPEQKKMAEALQAMAELIQLYDAASMFLEEEEYWQAKDLGKRFFSHYSWLQGWAQKKKRKLFHSVMKFHTFHHLVRESCDINPRCCWTFRSEDFVGKISKLGSSVAMGVKSTLLSGKLLLKYRILLHMELTRLGFDSRIPGDD